MDLDVQYKSIQEEIDEAIFKVIKSYKFLNGSNISSFEKSFAEAQEISYCLGCSSGTSALHIAYEVIGLQPGDEVIVPSMTFIATSEPLRQVGAIPKFIDIDPISYNIDVTKIEQAITKKTKAIVAVHLHGNPCNMEEIVRIAKKYNLKVVEDCAQAHLSEYNNKKVGSFGDISTFSFYPGKNLGAYGDAGAIVTNNKKYYEKAKILINHGRDKKYIHDIEGYNYRMDTIQAAVLEVKLKHLDEWTKKRIEIAKYYNKLLSDIEVTLPEINKIKKHVFHIYAICTPKRDKVIEALKQKHISYGIHYPLPLHLQPAYKHLNYHEGDLPVSEKLSKKFLSLPMYAELPFESIRLIAKTIKEVY